MTIEIREASSIAPQRQGKRWLVVCATPGQGSSGYYSEEVLREYGPKVFVPGTRAWLDHDPKRKLTDLVGVYEDGVYWNEEKRVLEGILTPVSDEWANFLEALGPLAAASMYCNGEIDENGNVTKLIPTRDASVDLVGYPGLVNSGVSELLENARGSALLVEKPGGTSPQEKEKNEMDEKLVERFETAVASLVSVQERAAEQNQATVDAEALEAAKISAIESFDAARKLIDAAEGLLPVQREALFEAAKRGEDVAPLIEREKTVAEQAKAAVLSESVEDGARSFGSVASAADLGKVLG